MSVNGSIGIDGTLSGYLTGKSKLSGSLDSKKTMSGEISRSSRNYEDLHNLPKINSVVLKGNLLLTDLGLQSIYYDTTANWDTQGDLISEKGSIYIYSDYSTELDDEGKEVKIPRIRIGDGETYLCDLPFLSDDYTYALVRHINDTVKHVSDAEREFWNNKVSSYIDTEDTENLVLSTDYYFLDGVLKHYG